MLANKAVIGLFLLCSGCTPFDAITGLSGVYGTYKNYQLEKRIKELENEHRHTKGTNSPRRRPMPCSIRMYAGIQDSRCWSYDQENGP
tara:strand:+ start:804 stop:1067 length:264 start_codon:yes stop_codon:yes gene_type:complete